MSIKALAAIIPFNKVYYLIIMLIKAFYFKIKKNLYIHSGY